jgi:hypothetical protein
MLSAAFLGAKFSTDTPRHTVMPVYLQTALEQVRLHYGSMNNYLQKVLEIDIGKMQSMFLESSDRISG